MHYFSSIWNTLLCCAFIFIWSLEFLKFLLDFFNQSIFFSLQVFVWFLYFLLLLISSCISLWSNEIEKPFQYCIVFLKTFLWSCFCLKYSPDYLLSFCWMKYSPDYLLSPFTLWYGLTLQFLFGVWMTYLKLTVNVKMIYCYSIRTSVIVYKH